MTIITDMILGILIHGAAIGLAAVLLPFVYVKNYLTAVIVGVLIALVSSLLVWTIGVIGLSISGGAVSLVGFLIAVAAIMIVSEVMKGFHVRNFFWAALFAVIVVVMDLLLRSVIDKLI